MNRVSGAHPVHVIRYPNTHALSGPVADLYRSWLTSDRLLVESFLLIDPIRTIEAGLVPLWTIFPVESAVRTTVDYLASREFQSVHIGLFPHGVESKGIAKPELWRESVSGAEFLGVDDKKFPADFAALVRYGSALRDMRRRRAPETLSVDLALESLARSGV